MNRIAVRFTLAMLAVMFITAIVEASLIGYSLYLAFERLPKESQKILEKKIGRASCRERVLMPV